MEEDFPRGAVIRRATRSTDEKKKCFVQLGVKRSLEDVLFKDSEQATPSKGKKKKKTKKSEGEETEEPDLEEEFEGATETEGFIPKTLTSKTLSEGMLVLAVVQEIHEYEIVLSLPNGQTAFVQITDVSSFFTQQLQELNESNGAEDQDLPNIQDVYQVGNLVPCKVKSLGASKDGHRRIQASLDYKEVNSELGISFIKAGMTLHGCVSSVEDHGYTIDLGIRGTNAFLAKEEATKGAKGRKGETMKTGKLVTCLVKAVKANGRSIILTFDPERLKSCKATKATHTTFSSLIPGTRLDAMVTKVLSNSLIMDIFGLYKGCVDPIHLKDTVDELTKYDIGQKLVAVVLYNCPTTKSIGLSLNPAHHKTTFDPATDVIRDLSPGDIIEAALVVRVQEKENLIVQLNPKTRGIVYHSHGSDDKQKRYSPASVGEKVRCRILSFNLFDRLAIVSMRKSILDKPFLGINDVKPGMLVKGVIESVMSRGVAVKIQDRIHGFVPRTHLADIPVQKPQERFTIGSEIELRVLLVEPAKRRVLLTHKKTMVKSSLPFLASYAQPKLGMWIHGCVVAVKDFGCIVSFYNDVKGIIPRAELGMDESSSPTDNFYVGQVLKCRVLRTHSPESKKLALSLRKDGRKERESFEAGKESEPSTSRMMDSIASEGSSESALEDESEEKLEDGYHEEADRAYQKELEEMQMELKKERERAEKLEKTLVLKKDTSPSNEFFQDIAESLKAFSSIMVESLKAFSSIMVHVKLMRLEMKTMKGMLQELTRKNKMVIERREKANDDDDNVRDGGQMGADREDSHCRGVLSRQMAKESKSTTDRTEGNEGTGLELERTGSPRNNDSGVGKVANSKGRSVKSRLSEAEITIIHRKIFLKSTAKFARNILKKLVSNDILVHSNCYGRYRCDCSRKKITPIDPDIVKYVLETTYGIFDVDVLMKKDCHRECVECMDAYCRRLHAKVRTRRSKNEADKNESPEKGKNFRDGDTSFKKDEDGTRVESDVRKGGAAEEKLPWEKLSEKEIADEWSDAAGWSWGTFARTILTKLVGNDVLAVSSCFVRFPQATGKRPVLPINPIILHDVLELTYDTFGIDESNKKGCDEECIRLINAQCRNQFEQRRKRVEKGGGARLPWERLSDYEISSIATRARTSEYFAKCLMTKLVSDDILINSSCSGVRSWEDYICSRPPVQRIDQGILNYALEKTIDVFAINELEKEKCIQECFISIDAYCRDLFRKSIKVKSGNGADGEGINEGKDIHETRHDRCTPERSRDSLDSVIVETDSDDEHGWYSPGEVNDIMEHDPMSDGSDVERVEVANVGGERTLESDDDSGDKCVGYNPNESEGRMANDPPRGENNDERDYVVVKVEEKLMETDSGLINEDKTGDEVGVHGTKRQYWEPLSEDSIIKIRAKAKTRGQFAEFVLTNMLDDGILKKSTWSWSSTALGKRSHAQPIDPDILRYILNTTYDMYGVEESDKENCFRECVKHVDAYCRLLSDMSEPKIERKQGETDENESTVEKKKRGIAGPENPLSQKEIWILHDKSSNWSCFARRLLSKFISNDILMNSNCAGKSGAMRSNVQAIDPNILRYVLDTTYRTYHVAEVERNICKSQCTTYIDNYCRQLHRKTRAMPGKRQNNADDGWVEDIYGR
ncbi:uncharacterized protein LOC115923994 isoform X3 [Strongylocentrotus purpuratus]|uniref:S1 motif domain-containing protein n=1 Tax=Strongylocentrotus purpuratus TaxID=7668 RepID=A0A7M7NT78_STRPU|nr:uncharacterized protein LOC115923994 isoform X3 [Strongylocentrotus purpuratus]